MKKLILILSILPLLSACIKTEETIEVLKENKYTNIVIVGYSTKGCIQNEMFHTQFTAIKDNKEVKGVVCSKTPFFIKSTPTINIFNNN